MIQTELWFKSGGASEEFSRLLRQVQSDPSNTGDFQHLVQLGERLGLEVSEELIKAGVESWVAQVSKLPATLENLQSFKDLLGLRWPLSRYVGSKVEDLLRGKVVEILGQQHSLSKTTPESLEKLWKDSLRVRMFPPIPWALAKKQTPKVSVSFSVMTSIYAMVERDQRGGDGNPVQRMEHSFAGEGFVAPGGKRNMEGPDDLINRWHLNLSSFFSGLHKVGYQLNEEGWFEKEIIYPVGQIRGRPGGSMVMPWTREHELRETWTPHMLDVYVNGEKFRHPSSSPMWEQWFKESA